jgi:hypothetical protein
MIHDSPRTQTFTQRRHEYGWYLVSYMEMFYEQAISDWQKENQKKKRRAPIERQMLIQWKLKGCYLALTKTSLTFEMTFGRDAWGLGIIEHDCDELEKRIKIVDCHHAFAAPFVNQIMLPGKIFPDWPSDHTCMSLSERVRHFFGTKDMIILPCLSFFVFFGLWLREGVELN